MLCTRSFNRLNRPNDLVPVEEVGFCELGQVKLDLNLLYLAILYFWRSLGLHFLNVKVGVSSFAADPHEAADYLASHHCLASAVSLVATT